MSINHSTKKVAILQSNYIPWKGYFDLINYVDEFILYDDVQYTKNDWRNRNKIKTRSGFQWLTIPVLTSSRFGQSIKDTQIADFRWNSKHWKSIYLNYSKAKNFYLYKDVLEQLYMQSNEKYLSSINYNFLATICQILGITTKISWSMDYKVQTADDKTTRLVSLCKQANATEYISGPSARSYMKTNLFEEESIRISYFDYSDYKEYQQLFPPFEHEVSVIDLLLNTGKNATQYMKTF